MYRVSTVQTVFQYCVLNQFAFALHRLPNSEEVRLVLQLNTDNAWVHKKENPAQKGFLFAPFNADSATPEFFIVADIDTRMDAFFDIVSRGNISPLPAKTAMDRPIHSVNKQDYLHYLSTVIEELNNGSLHKIVASRTQAVPKPEDFKESVVFVKALIQYPTAFVSFVYVPNQVTWITASPELLLGWKNEELFTQSIAGTRLAQEPKAQWGEKEREEQKLVTDYIEQTLKTVVPHPPIISTTETITAAHLEHLRTTFTYRNVLKESWQTMAELLHPTPAVGGLPKEKAMEYIIRNEPNQRRYYSGYLGPVNIGDQVHLFVNIRCMEVLEKQLALYAGGGILKNSDPEKEWEETEQKMRVMGELISTVGAY